MWMCVNVKVNVNENLNVNVNVVFQGSGGLILWYDLRL